MSYIIYLAKNNINGKCYVGQTKEGRLDQRIFEHTQDAIKGRDSYAFHRAILKNGIDNFTFSILEQNIADTDVDERERYWIKHLNTYIHAPNSNGYNETFGGQGTHGYVFSEADKEKISIGGKRYWADLRANNPEKFKQFCIGNSVRQKGKKFSAEHKKHISEAAKGRTPWNKGLKNAQKAWNKDINLGNSVFMYELSTGKYLREFNNPNSAARFLFPDADKVQITDYGGRIAYVCGLKKGHAYGYIWRFTKDFDSKDLDSAIVAAENKPARARAIIQYDLKMNKLQEYESAAAFSRTVAASYSRQRAIAKCVSQACIKNKPYRGFFWKLK